jgi:hypothetical protein
MPKRISTTKSKRPSDVNELADYLVNFSTRDAVSTREAMPATREQVSHFMALMGRKGGKIGGKRRMFTMSAKQRSTAASNAAKARWEKK